MRPTFLCLDRLDLLELPLRGIIQTLNEEFADGDLAWSGRCQNEPGGDVDAVSNGSHVRSTEGTQENDLKITDRKTDMYATRSLHAINLALPMVRDGIADADRAACFRRGLGEPGSRLHECRTARLLHRQRTGRACRRY